MWTWMLVACGSGDGAVGADADPWGPVRSAVDEAAADAPVPGMVLSVWDADDRLVFTHTAGAFDREGRVAVASASKLVTALVTLRLIDEGVLTLDTTIGDVFAASGAFGSVTVDQLGAFVSGLPEEDGCTLLAALELSTCARLILAGDPVAPPGERLAYGSAHMQVLGAMAEDLTDLRWQDVFSTRLAEPLGLSDPGLAWYTWPQERSGDANPLVAGGLVATVEEYRAMLSVAFHAASGEDGLVSPALAARLHENRWTGAEVGAVPETAVPSDLRYGFGSWLTCPGPQASCEVVSSPGAYGFTPWWDRAHGYYAILAMESAAPGEGSGAAVPLMESLLPLIPGAL